MREEAVWLRGELIASRLGPEEPLPGGARCLDADDALRDAGGVLAPGCVTLPPAWIGGLCRSRRNGLRPLIVTCARPPDSDPEAARTGALELDVLSGGTLDAIGILPPETRAQLVASGALRAIEPPSGEPGDLRTDADEGVGSVGEPDRILGSLLGLAVGDCLGAPVENWPAEKIVRVHGSFRDYVSGRGWGPGHPTRETTFALLWFREFANGRTVHRAEDRDRLAQALARWVIGRPRDFGHLTRGVLRGYLEGPPVPTARQAWGRAGRQPEFNAALSRAVAVGVALPHDPDLRWTSAIAASALTQVAPVDLACAVAIAEGVAAAVRGSDPVDAARACTWEMRTAVALDEVAGGWVPGGPEWNSHGRSHPLKSLQSAFWAARQQRSLEEVLLDLVHRGGDADTHGALAGAFLGARDGPGAIPQRWLEPLRTRELIVNLAGKFRAKTFRSHQPREG